MLYHALMAVRVRRTLESDTIRIPELRELIGRDVEIVVSEIPAPPRGRSLHGSVLRYDGPFEPVASEDWEALA